MSDSQLLTIYFVHKDGKQTEVKVPAGFTIMEAARSYAEPSIDEIAADCGGCCACGTCHINIKEHIDKVGRVEYDSLENEILENNMEYDRMSSRLACQVMLQEKHNGFKIYLRDMESV